MREEINSLRQKLEQNELEQKLTYFSIIKRFLLMYNLYMAMIMIYQTFKFEYDELIEVSEIDITDKPNTFTLLMILYRTLPYVLTKKNVAKSFKKSVLFLISLGFISRHSEFYRNTGFLISTSYSIYCAWNFNHFSYFKHHILNIILNILHVTNRYIWLHGLTSFGSMEGL